MLEEVRTFQNGFDDPGPAAAKTSLAAQSQQTPGTTEAALASEDPGVHPALVEPGCVGGSHCHASVTLCPVLAIHLSIHLHSGLQGRELVHTEPMRTDRGGQSSKAWEMNLR